VFRCQKRAGNDIEGEERSLFFCPHCGTTVYHWTDPEQITVPVGAFADRHFPAPRVSVWEDRMHPWVGLPEGIEHTSAELLQALTAPAFRGRRERPTMRDSRGSPPARQQRRTRPSPRSKTSEARPAAMRSRRK
jgi:Glutathione-dependent formaldehyde-activating enzyme